MKRLDSLDEELKKKEAELAKRQVKREKQPRKAAFKEPIVEEEYHPPPQPKENPAFHINGSPRTASRQLMEHLHMQQRERTSARERMYENFLPL